MLLQAMRLDLNDKQFQVRFAMDAQWTLLITSSYCWLGGHVRKAFFESRRQSVGSTEWQRFGRSFGQWAANKRGSEILGENLSSIIGAGNLDSYHWYRSRSTKKRTRSPWFFNCLVLSELKENYLESVMISLPNYGAQLTLAEFMPLWRVVEDYIDKQKLLSAGVCDFMLPLLSGLCDEAKVIAVKVRRDDFCPSRNRFASHHWTAFDGITIVVRLSL